MDNDWVLIAIIFIILIAIALLTMNLDVIFPTPTIQQALP